MSTETGRLGVLDVAGSHFDVGIQLGRFGREIAHRHLVNTRAWASVMAFRDHPDISVLRALTHERFPAYWQELQGLARGLDLPFDDVFLWNCRGDVWAMSPDGCTTVQIPGEEPVLAHNEDGDPGLRGSCAIAKVQPEDGRAFTAFVYPASLPGHTFAVTDSGLVQTVNNIRPCAAGPGMPRMLLGRAVLDCTTIDEAIRLLKGTERAGAFHMTLGQRGDGRLTSVEFTHSTCSAVTVEQTRCHSNHLVHDAIRNEKQIVTGSSQARQERGDQIIANGGGQVDPLTILWDKQNETLPIYRRQHDDPDNENTLATAIFHIGRQSVRLEVYDQLGATPISLMA